MQVVRKTIKKSKKNICPCMQKMAWCQGKVRWVPNPLAVSEAKVPHYTNTILGFKSMMGFKEGDTVGDLLYGFSESQKLLTADNIPAQLLSENGIDEMATTTLFGDDSKLLSQVENNVTDAGFGDRFKVNKVLGVLPPQVSKKIFGKSISGMVFIVKLDDTRRPIKVSPEKEEKDEAGNVVEKYQSKIVAVSSNTTENQFLETWLSKTIAPLAESEFEENNKLILQDEIKKEIERKKAQISNLKEVLLKVAKGTNFIKELDNLEVTNIPAAEIVETKIPGCDFSYVLKVTFEGKVYDPKSIKPTIQPVVKPVVIPTREEQKA